MGSTVNKFNINATNNSMNSGSFMIFQRDSSMQQQVFSLAWMTQYGQPNTNVKFTWEENYAFVFGQTGTLQPGIQFRPSQEYRADLTTNNAITLSNSGFTNQQSQSPSGCFYIQQDASIPMGRLSVGIAIANAPAMVVQAVPNAQTVFTPTPEYWIAFGNFNAGTVLDTYSLNNSARLVFPSGKTTLNVTLNPNGTWSIQ